MVTLKLAETADGFAAGAPGAPRLKITGEAANGRVHMLRALHDAVMVGVGTALADDPRLTVRLPGLEDRKPLRIVLEFAFAAAAIGASRHDGTRTSNNGHNDRKALRRRPKCGLVAKGVEVVRVEGRSAGHVDLAAALDMLGAQGLTRIFCEGGPHLAAALIAQKLADDSEHYSKVRCGSGSRACRRSTPQAAPRSPTRSIYRKAAQGIAGEDSLFATTNGSFECLRGSSPMSARSNPSCRRAR